MEVVAQELQVSQAPQVLKHRRNCAREIVRGQVNPSYVTQLAELRRDASLQSQTVDREVEQPMF
jgi:hypothetical protein